MTIAYTTGQITLTNGSAVVTGIGTAWQVSLIAGGFIAAEADGNPLPIETVDSDTSITAAIEWKGASGTYDYALVRDTAYLQQLNVNSNTLARLIAELDAGTIFKYDASGDLAGRATYDERVKGFSYLVFIGVDEPALYVKASAAAGDWDGPFSYGTGPQGPKGDTGLVNWRGAYSNAAAYLKNDGVYDQGCAWIALQPTTGNAPPTLPTLANVYWSLMAMKGADGAGDMTGPGASVDNALAAFAGTTGKLLKTATMPTKTLKGRTSAGNGVIEDLSAAQARAVIGVDIVGGFRNKIINGDGAINQRAATTAVDDAYGHDAHYALTQAAAIAVSTLGAPANGIRSMMRLVQSQAAAQRMGYAHILEAADTWGLRGKTVTLGGKLRYSNAAAIRYAVLEWTGTADSVVSDVVNNWASASFTAGGFFLASNLVVSQVGSITPAASTITDWSVTANVSAAANNIIVVIWTEAAAAQSSTLDFRWYLVEGDATLEADPFSPRLIGAELALCQRRALAIDNAIGNQYSTNGTSLTVFFPVQMRALPGGVATTLGVTSLIIAGAGVASGLASLSALTTSTKHVRMGITHSAIGAVGQVADAVMTGYLSADL